MTTAHDPSFPTNVEYIWDNFFGPSGPSEPAPCKINSIGIAGNIGIFNGVGVTGSSGLTLDLNTGQVSFLASSGAGVGIGGGFSGSVLFNPLTGSNVDTSTNISLSAVLGGSISRNGDGDFGFSALRGGAEIQASLTQNVDVSTGLFRIPGIRNNYI